MRARGVGLVEQGEEPAGFSDSRHFLPQTLLRRAMWIKARSGLGRPDPTHIPFGGPIRRVSGLETYLPCEPRAFNVANAPRDLLQLLANPTNRSILSVLSLEPQYPRRLAQIVGLTEDEASKRLRLFEKAGLADGTWAHVGKNVRLYKLATTQFTVLVEPQGLVVRGVKGGSPLHVGPAAETPPSTEHFQGRETELADLATLLADRPAVCILGIGGSGKTAIAARLSQTLGRPVLWHTLAASESGPLLLGRLAAAQRLNDAGDRAQRLLEVRAAEDETLLRVAFLESINATRTLVVLDRFEAAAEGAAEEAAHWVRALTEARILLTSRTFPSGLPRDRVASFRLGALTRTDAQTVLASYGPPTSADVLAEIYDRTHGHALSLVLVAQVPAAGREARVERLLQESGIREFFIDDVLPQLPDGERTLLFALSVLRLPFTAAEAEAVSEDRYARHTLLKLETRGLVARAGDTFLLHDLVRAFVVEAAPQPKVLHARAAKALGTSGEPVKILEAVYHHLEAGHLPEAGVLIRDEVTRRAYRFMDLGYADRYRAVLERAVTEPAFDARGRAAAYLELGILDTFEGEPERAAKRLSLVEATLGGILGEMTVPLLIAKARHQRITGHIDEANRTLVEAERQARSARNPRLELEALIDRGFLEEERDDAVAFKIFEKAIELGEKTSDILLLSLAYSGAARIGMRDGDDRHLRWAEEGLRLSRLAGYLRGEVSVYMTLTTHAIMTGETKTGLEFSKRYLEVAHRLGDPWLKACALGDKAMLLIATKTYGEALEVGLEAQRLGRKIRSPFYDYAASIIVAEAYLGLGQPQKALRAIEAGNELKVQAWPSMMARGWRALAATLRVLGRRADAKAAQAKADHLGNRPKDPSHEWAEFGQRRVSVTKPVASRTSRGRKP